jgi:hypothetical protein
MHSPLRKAAWWLLGALVGAALLAAGIALFADEEDYGPLALGVIGLGLLPICLFMALTAALSGLGAWRLARGIGMIAQWRIEPAAWEAFRAFAARRAAEPGALPNDVALHAAQGAVEVRFGRRQVMVGDAYHPLRRYGLPELRGLGWLQPPDAPECIEFTLVYPRGRYGGTVSMGLRVPVAPAARADAVRVFEHFRAVVPQPRIGLATRRPGLVIGWGLGFTALAGLVALVGWVLHERGDQSLEVMLAMLGGMIFAIGGALFTAIIVLAVQPWKRGG